MQKSSHLNPNHNLEIQILSILFSSFSLIASILFIFLMVYFKNHHIFLFRMIICVFISDIIISVANLLIPILLNHFNENLCNAQAFLSNFGALSSMAWSTAIFFSLYQTVVKLNRIDHWEKKYFLLSFGFPLILSAMYINFVILIILY